MSEVNTATAPTSVAATALPFSAADVHDRVTDAYFGKMGEAFMRETQQRIHWICERIAGQKVLDVGCSQGITTLLLAREGKQVVGIDVDAKAIAEARAYLSQEPDRVQQCAQLEQGDFLSLPTPEKPFDTLVMTEVLEHLVQPSAFIEAAPRYLKTGGRLVVTVPFGVNDFIDHKHTYYLLEPYRLISARFDIEEVKVLGRWIGFTGVLRSGKAAIPDLTTLEASLVAQLEGGFEALERELRSDAKSYRSKLHEANLKYRNVTEQVASFKQRLAAEESALKQAQSALQENDSRLQQVKRAAEELEKRHDGAAAHIANLQEERAALLNARDRLRDELQSMQIRLAQTQAQTEELRERVAAQDQQLLQWPRSLSEQTPLVAAKAEAQLESFSQIQRDLLTELQSLRQAHATEREQWQQRLNTTDQRREEACAQLSHAELALASLQGEHRFAQQRLEAVSEDLSELRLETQRERQELHAKCESLQQRVTELLPEIASLRAAMTDLHDELSAVTCDRDRLERELVDLRATHLSMEEQLRAASVQLENQGSLLASERSAWQVEMDRQAQHAVEARQREADALAKLEEHQQRALALNSEVDTQRAVGLDHRRQKERLQLQLLHAKRHAEELRAELEQARHLRQVAEEQVVRTRSTFSFRLGYALLHGFKSLDTMRRLPAQLWALHREGQARRQQRQGAGKSIRSAPTARPLALGSPEAPAKRPGSVHTATLLPRELPASESLRSLKVAAIMDEFTRASFAPECNLLSLSVDHWQAELEAFKPDMLFIESAWRGKDDRWGNKVGHLSAEVQGVLAWCHEHQVPTAFWNKEDPIHFETFLNTAQLFDHVFTTDIDCIPRYKAALEHDRVHLLPFACQPALSNPIEQYERKDAFCFAGAYYVRYPERTRDLGNFVSHLAEYRPVEIYDRNFGKQDPNYQFPPEYQPFIVGTLPFDQIDKAYKGYRYAINLNSIKQSQSMFARRVFELLASNTLTISNFSRGVRTLFGDLVVTSDSGQEVIRRLQALESNPQRAALLRLAGLRKVMREHTYQDRLAFVVGHLQGRSCGALLPGVTVTAYAKNQAQWDALWTNYSRQAYEHKQLLVLTPNDFTPERTEAAQLETVRVLKAADVADSVVSAWVDPHEWVAGMVPDDHYGPHYLTDLALATRYANSPLVGKGTHALWSRTHGHKQHRAAAPYTRTGSLPARAALVHQPLLANVGMKEWVTTLYTRAVEQEGALSVDPFSYCKNGAGAVDQLSDLGDEIAGGTPLDEGLSLAEVLAYADTLPAHAASVDTAPKISGADWAAWFKPPTNKPWRCHVEGVHWVFQSDLGDGKHDYLYAGREVTPAELGATDHLKFHLDVSPGLNLQMVVLFLDANRQRISPAVKVANRNHEVGVPTGTAFIRLGLRVYGSGTAHINALVLGHRPQQPGATLPRAQHLLLTNHYPSYDDLYRNGFVHSRVTAYRERGVAVDVFRLRTDQATSYHEYQNIDVVTGSQEALHRLLSTGQYKTVLVHFLDPAMWAVLQQHIDQIRVLVWVHGAEIQPWHRRDYNYETEQERQIAKLQSEERTAFWRALLEPMHANMHLVFVSRIFSSEVMEDLGITLPDSAFSIIHNPIDTCLFSYQSKPDDQRKKILSIRSYASRKYANDLSVAAILELSKKHYFKELEFRIIGDGDLFEKTIYPLLQFSNVIIERRFVSQTEISSLQKNYGVFLCPTRWDSQGVSRDEAMASGLVPVTNAVSAVSEFVDESCAILAENEDYKKLAEGIARMVEDPSLFQTLSNKAAARVRQQSDIRLIIATELECINQSIKRHHSHE